jgi:hypothetical protein
LKPIVRMARPVPPHPTRGPGRPHAHRPRGNDR